MSVELDAIEPDTLREMIEDCIYEVMDTEILQQTLDKQAIEKDWIKNFVRNTDLKHWRKVKAVNEKLDIFHICISCYAQPLRSLATTGFKIFPQFS